MKKRVECIGLPGTGKTSWSHVITASLNKNENAATIQESFQAGLKQIMKNEKSAFRYKAAILLSSLIKKDFIPNLRTYNETISNFAVKHPLLMENVWRLLKHVPEGRQQVILKLFLRDVLMWEISLQDPTAEIVLMDEGFVQRMAALTMHRKEEKQNRLLEEMKYPDIIFYFLVPATTAEQRLQDRKQGVPPGFRHMSKEQRTMYWEQMKNSLNEAAEECEKNGTKIIYINNEAGRSQTKRQIIKKIKDM